MSVRPLNIFLINVADNLPVDNAKLMRTGLLANELVRQGHTVCWISATFSHFQKKNLYEQDTTLTIHDRLTIQLFHTRGYQKNISLARCWHYWRLAGKLKKYLQTEPKPDLIVVSHPAPELCYVAVNYAKKQHIPVIVDVRDMWPDIFLLYFTGFKKIAVGFFVAIMQRVVKFYLKNASGICSMSPSLLNWASNQTAGQQPKAVFFLGTALDYLERENQLPSLNLTKSAQEIFCVYSGSLANNTGVEVMLDAAVSGLADKRVRFLVAGTGEKIEQLKKQYGGDPRIIFLGWLNQADLVALLSQADIFIMPSTEFYLQPCCPNKFFDYLWAGKPILISMQGEAAEYVEKYQLGYVFKSGNVDDFIEKLNRLCDNELREEMAHNIRKIYPQEFSARKIYPEYVRLIESLAEKRELAL